MQSVLLWTDPRWGEYDSGTGDEMRINRLLPLVAVLIASPFTLSAQVSSDPTTNLLGITDRLSAMTADDVKNLSARVQQGDPEAEFWLGMLYADGRAVPKDKARSENLLLQSAEKGYAPAEYRVGMMFYPQDIPKAEKWLLAAAGHGNAEAQMWLGAAYEQQWFGITDLQEAQKWYRKAAEQGQPDAQTELGMMYEQGDGVPQDYVAAVGWYRKAAEHFPNLGGAGQGRNHLGLLYLQGLGVPTDYVQAFLWFSVSGNESDREYVRSLMTAKQMEEAQRLTAEWKQRHPQPQETSTVAADSPRQ